MPACTATRTAGDAQEIDAAGLLAAIDDNPRRLTQTLARIITGGFGNASKMPGRTYGISADLCQTGAELAKVEGSICSDCYATKGHYRYDSVATAHANRLAAIHRAIDDPDYRALFIRAAALLINAGGEWFRLHDSGDLQGEDYALLWMDVARATPDVRWWIPTRERGLISRLDATRPGWQAPNVTIRVSDVYFDQTRRSVPGDRPASGAHKGEPQADAYRCPAPDQGNACGDCRACWNPAVPFVTYRAH
jgi:hypothetical protein